MKCGYYKYFLGLTNYRGNDTGNKFSFISKSNSNSNWSVKEEDVMRLERNDKRMFRWMCNVRPEGRICTEELRTGIKLKSIRECLWDMGFHTIKIKYTIMTYIL